MIDAKGRKQFVLSIIFDSAQENVLLITKNRPDYQKGKLNGIGGKLEELDESPLHGAKREIKEECGLDIPLDQIIPFGEMGGEDWVGYLFAAIAPQGQTISQETDEEVRWYSTQALPNNLMDSINWLVPMAQTVLNGLRLTTKTVYPA